MDAARRLQVAGCRLQVAGCMGKRWMGMLADEGVVLGPGSPDGHGVRLGGLSRLVGHLVCSVRCLSVEVEMLTSC